MQNMKRSFIIYKECRDLQTFPPMTALILNLQDSESHKQTLDNIATLASISRVGDLMICHLIFAEAVQEPVQSLFLECEVQFSQW